MTRRWELIPEKLIVIPDGDASKAASKTTSGTIHVQADTSDASNAAATTVLDDDDHGVSVMPVSITTELEDADDGPTMTVDDLLEMNSPDSPDSPENEMEQLRDADDASVPVTLDDDEDDDDLFTSTVVRE